MTNLVETASTEAAPVVEEPSKEIAGRSPTQIAFERLRKDKVFVICGSIVAFLVIVAVLAPVISGAMHITWSVSGKHAVDPLTSTDSYNYPCTANDHDGCTTTQNFRGIFSSGSGTFKHPLGIAADTGTDNLSTLLYGMRNSFFIAAIATICTTIIGLAIGLMAGFSRGWLDRVLSFVIDLFLSFPYILLAIAVAPMITTYYKTDIGGLQRAQFIALILILGLLSWMGLARLVRGQVISLREREFVLAAQVIGASTWRILVKELIPNLVATLVVALSIALPGFIAAEVGLSYLGLGLTGEPSMGQLMTAAQNYYDSYPLYLWAPIFVLVVLVLSLNLLGDSIRDAFDPKTRR